MKSNIVCIVALLLFAVVSLYTLGVLVYTLYLLLTPELTVFSCAVFNLFLAAVVGSDR